MLFSNYIYIYIWYTYIYWNSLLDLYSSKAIYNYMAILIGSIITLKRFTFWFIHDLAYKIRTSFSRKYKRRINFSRNILLWLRFTLVGHVGPYIHNCEEFGYKYHTDMDTALSYVKLKRIIRYGDTWVNMYVYQ